MLINPLRILVYKLFLETFYWENDKKKKKMLLTVFFFSHESSVKTFLLWFINNCPQGIR